MKSIFAGVSIFLLAVGVATLEGGGAKGDDPREALQAIQDYVGAWKGSGNAATGGLFWKETANWGWDFKSKEPRFVAEFETSKNYKSGALRFMSDKGKYELTLVDKADNKLVFIGELKKDKITFERVDPKTKDTQQIVMNSAANGDRLIYTYLVKPAERTFYNKQYQVAYTREGVTFAAQAGNKKPECCVTGGLGTSTVSYKGATYYVCCTGCRDAFNDNPEKIIKEFLAKKKAGN